MKKGRKITALLLAVAAVGAMTAGFAACEGDDDPQRQEQSTAAEKIKDGGAIVFTDGRASIDLTQYVKANGNTFRVGSSNESVVTAVVSGNTLTVNAAGGGSAIITVVCGEVRLTFSAFVPEAFYTVTLDGETVTPEEGDKWKAGASYTLPEAKTPTDPNTEFKGWNVNGERKQAGETVTVDSNLTITAVFERKAAHEVSGHAQSVSLNEGKTATVTIADYIAAYGREVTANADETDIVSVSLQDGIVTLTGVATGTATLILSTEGVTVSVEVKVLSADMPTFANATLDIDLFTQESNSFAFVPQEPSDEHTYSYVYSLQTQDARASVTDDTLTYTPGADYDIKEDGAAHSLIVAAAVTMDGAPAGTVTFTVTVRIKDTAPEAPEFANVTETFDPFTDSGYTLVLKADDENFTYTYEIGGKQVEGNKVYKAEADETVSVTYVYKGNTNKSGTASFTVKVSYDRSVFPALKEESKSADVDLALVKDGVYVVDLFSNFSNSGNIASYTVNGTEHTDGTVYSVSNSGGEYGETAKAVTFSVVATVKNSLGDPLTYTYTVNVTDTTAFRMANGGFENGLNGWTGATGNLNSAGTYWEVHSMNNDGQYYDGTVSNTETLVSPSFTVGGSGWITFKFGSAKPVHGNELRNVHLEFYEKGEGDDRLIADVRNILFEDPDAALKLNDYKLDLSAYKGKTVYARAVDGENGNGDFRFVILDAFVTYWKNAPTDTKYTDLTAARYYNPTVRIDLKDSNTATLNPFLSQGLVATPDWTAEVDKAGLTTDAENPLLVTAVNSGNYTIAYKLNGDTVFTASVNVNNTVDIPSFENKALKVKKGESGTLSLPVPEVGSRFTYSYAVTANGASIEDGVLTFAAAESEEGVYPVQVSVTVTDRKWGENGDVFNRTFTVNVTVYGSKIIAGDLLDEGKAELSVDAYAIREKTPGATAAQIDFSKYLIIPEDVNTVYTVTRKIGSGEAASVSAENGLYALPFADCDLSVNAVTVVFEVTAANGADAANSVAFTLTVSIRDTAGNRIENGGFETGNLTGWTATNVAHINEAVSGNAYYWDKHPYNQGGSYHFDGWAAQGAEADLFNIKSTNFILGGSGFISFKIGGRTAVVKVFKADGTQIAEYGNPKFSNRPFTTEGAFMTTYVADLHEYLDQELYIELHDAGTSDWGVAFFDDIVTYYETAPVAADKADVVTYEGKEYRVSWENALNQYAAPAKE